MVLVSNSKKFIFIKPYLCNGRYIEYNLQKYCKNKNDIIASMYNYNKNKNNQRNCNILQMKEGIYPWYCYVHLPLYILKKKINNFYKNNIFDTYFKISIIKNPYILLIDFFWFYTDFIQKGYSNNGSIIYNEKKNPNNIYFYKNKVHANNKWENVKSMFNNWILSGILEKKTNIKMGIVK